MSQINRNGRSFYFSTDDLETEVAGLKQEFEETAIFRPPTEPAQYSVLTMADQSGGALPYPLSANAGATLKSDVKINGSDLYDVESLQLNPVGANPGGATALWSNSGDSNKLYYGASGFLSQQTLIDGFNTNLLNNSRVLYTNSSGQLSSKTMSLIKTFSNVGAAAAGAGVVSYQGLSGFLSTDINAFSSVFPEPITITGITFLTSNKTLAENQVIDILKNGVSQAQFTLVGAATQGWTSTDISYAAGDLFAIQIDNTAGSQSLNCLITMTYN